MNHTKRPIDQPTGPIAGEDSSKSSVRDRERERKKEFKVRYILKWTSDEKNETKWSR